MTGTPTHTYCIHIYTELAWLPWHGYHTRAAVIIYTVKYALETI